MPTKPLDRLLFAQGDLCFFCRSPLPKADASVEQLVASAKGGGNGDDNCVVCPCCAGHAPVLTVAADADPLAAPPLPALSAAGAVTLPLRSTDILHIPKSL